MSLPLGRDPGRDLPDFGANQMQLEQRRRALGLNDPVQSGGSAQESERDRRLRLRAEERARRLAGGTDSVYSGPGGSTPAYPRPEDRPLTQPFSGAHEEERLRKYREEFDKQPPANPSPTVYAPFPGPSEDQQTRDIEKKQRYAQELRDAMNLKSQQKERERQESTSLPIESASETRQNEQMKERQLQYRLTLEKQMEEQKKRKEEEKRLLKQKSLQDEEKYLAEFAGEQKRTGKKVVTDPNRPSPDNPNAERYEAFASVRKHDEEDRPIGVAAKPPRPLDRAEDVRLREAVPRSPQGVGQAMSSSTISTHSGSHSETPIQYNAVQRQEPPVYPGYAAVPQPVRDTERMPEEMKDLIRETDRLKAEMLEYKEMMIKEKENKLLEMKRMAAAQQPWQAGPPAQWPGYPVYQPYSPYPPYPYAAPMPMQPPIPMQPVMSMQPPIPMQPGMSSMQPAMQMQPATSSMQHAMPGQPPMQMQPAMSSMQPHIPTMPMKPATSMQGSTPRAAPPVYPAPASLQRQDPTPMQSSLHSKPDLRYFSPSDASKFSPPSPVVSEPTTTVTPHSTRLKAPGIPVIPRKDTTDFFEQSLSGTSKFVDPDSMQWGTTKLLASVQRLPGHTPFRQQNLKPEEMDHSLPSTVEHVPIDSTPSADIEEVIEEVMEDEEEVVSTPITPPVLPTLCEELSPIQPPDTDLSRMTENDHVSIPSPVTSEFQPTMRGKGETGGDRTIRETSPFIPPPVDRGNRSSSASRSRPKTLDVFKVMKVPPKSKPAFPKPSEKPKDLIDRTKLGESQESSGSRPPTCSYYSGSKTSSRRYTEPPQEVE